jgi:hypothetical protein
MGDLSFSKTRNGYMARKASGIDGRRLLKDPSFQRTRWNMTEFGACSKAASLIHRGINYQTSIVKDGSCYNRLMSTMNTIKDMDVLHPRGLRTVMGGLMNEAALNPLKNFSLNIAASMKSKLQVNMEIDTSNGSICLKKFNPARQLLRPDASVQVCFQSTWLQVDLDGDYHDKTMSDDVYLPILNLADDFVIPISIPLTKQGLNLLLLQVSYYESDGNGGLIPFNDMKWNPWSIVGVWMT